MGTDRRFQTHPQSAPGDFYVINHECMSCGAPHAVAPGLIGWADGADHCIWKKQPETSAEFSQAVDAFAASCVGCYRYAGTDTAIMEQIGRQYCDHHELLSDQISVSVQTERVPAVKFALLERSPSVWWLVSQALLRFVRRLFL